LIPLFGKREGGRAGRHKIINLVFGAKWGVNGGCNWGGEPKEAPLFSTLIKKSWLVYSVHHYLSKKLSYASKGRRYLLDTTFPN